MSDFHISLTGHRPSRLAGYDLSLPFYDRLREALALVVIQQLDANPSKHLVLHSGMALGADTAWAMIILSVKEMHPGRISFVAEVPVMTQPDRWPNPLDRHRWSYLVGRADRTNVYAERYNPGCLWDRNRGMIEAADLLIAVWDGHLGGGTAGAVAYARQRNIPILRLDPKGFRS